MKLPPEDEDGAWGRLVNELFRLHGMPSIGTEAAEEFSETVELARLACEKAYAAGQAACGKWHVTVHEPTVSTGSVSSGEQP